ncbi:hypothetical protein QJS65_10560 [Bacillus altitudinis]|uniref:hypothetical protein n=1 Tax=Bacillus altitudinis TaxID=293387 RepID=UPI0024A7E0E2|nr:hypothetical protein [Bacillus altitudinis]WHF25291.1 hypothetical protein QJS65_10560 [Bacillus altitudinis]
MNENNPIISSVITKLHKQQEKGLQKYGVEVETSSYDLKGLGYREVKSNSPELY